MSVCVFMCVKGGGASVNAFREQTKLKNAEKNQIKAYWLAGEKDERGSF